MAQAAAAGPSKKTKPKILETLRAFGVARGMTLAPLFAFYLCDASFHQFLDEGDRQRLSRGEVDGAFGGGKGFQFVLEGCDHGRGGEEA